MFVAVKCDRSLDAVVGRDRSFVDGSSGRRLGDGLAAPGDEVGVVAGGENIKRSRDYRTSSRSNLTTSVSSAAVRTSTIGRTAWISPLITSPSASLTLIVVVVVSHG